jgi:hypothetical protein
MIEFYPFQHVRRPCQAAVIFILCLAGLTTTASAAELQFREATLRDAATRLTKKITARIDHLGKKAHPIAEDCDLHVPLRSNDFRIPMIGEVKNACSIPEDATPTSLRDQIEEAIGDNDVPVVGVFRIWLEHPPKGKTIQREGGTLPAYNNSNPDHQVELHPLLSIGDLDFHDHITDLKHKSARYTGYGTAELRTLLGKTINVRTLDRNGESYVAISGAKMGYNHWLLRAIVRGEPRPLDDAIAVTIDITDRGRAVKEAGSLTAFAIKGTAAYDTVQGLKPDDRVVFQALGRLSIATIMQAAAPGSGREVRLPIEFILLTIKSAGTAARKSETPSLLATATCLDELICGAAAQ